MKCEVCEPNPQDFPTEHFSSPRHISNKILYEYRKKKQSFVKNRDGVAILGNGKSKLFGEAPTQKVDNCKQQKIRIYALPNQKVKFWFHIINELNDDSMLFVGTHLGHPQPQFLMNDHNYVFGETPYLMEPKSSILEEIIIRFRSEEIGEYEMPIMFTFHRPSIGKNLIIIREMVVNVQDDLTIHPFIRSPFKNEDWEEAKEFIKSTDHVPYEVHFKIPKSLKLLLPTGLNEDSLQKIQVPEEKRQEIRKELIKARAIFDEGPAEANYVKFFHYLLWWEEIIVRINLRRYNMAGVTIEMRDDLTCWLEVPGLAEKRPSLLRGDRAYLRPVENKDIIFESTIGRVKESFVQLTKMDERFYRYYRAHAQFNVRFMLCRVPFERMHAAVDRVFAAGQGGCVFPQPTQPVRVKHIFKFYNKLIKDNEEQRSAVEHIVSNTSGTAPYIVFGPPGTGKTMTIVEAIIQIVVQSPSHRVLVCTDSNMAADHIALMLLRYNRQLNISDFLLRANSQNREWSIMPAELHPVSNGCCAKTFSPVSNTHAASFRVLVTTLLHAAKYGSYESYQTPGDQRLEVTHLFIDEAAQAKEPAALVPLAGLLARRGRLVLAGDPKQLGPVCISNHAAEKGLGTSLLERLYRDYKDLYDNNPAYITTLVQNFRSDPDILHIPNKLFYSEKPLQARAEPDPLSRASILGLPGGDRAVVFHSIMSKEQRMGEAPSFFNEKELYMLQRYMTALITDHDVLPKDIGIIAPYIRQVYKMRDWLQHNDLEEVEIGTVESFQGKEKRVILVSTVRANCRLLDYDARYKLGFLVDYKRFNVALTRAKAKLVIIGNSTCLSKDSKWREYMDFCKELNCYIGEQTEQLPRTELLLTEIAQTRFRLCRLDVALKEKKEEKDEHNKKKNLRKN